ncbi:hypothetical protein [Fibrella aquatica]|jgi:hypothetical protein|uniref:hypothetical protein n=1 Tax=Fibrella aquatica TaxID=3242487 RepID=UPI0035216571
MEAVESVLTPEEENIRIVERYKAFLKRRAEEHAKDDADPERQRRIAEATETLKRRNAERGTPVIEI